MRSAGVRVDPYFEWAKITDYIDLGGKPERLPVIIEFDTQHTPEELSKADRTLIDIHPLYTTRDGPLDRSRYCTGLVTETFFELVAAGEGIGESPGKLKVRRFELALPIVARLFIEKPANNACKETSSSEAKDYEMRHEPDHIEKGPPPCVVAVIDDGFAFAHERFRAGPTTTRILSFWDQGRWSTAPSTTRRRSTATWLLH
jgi:hypothetical protein